MVGANYENGHKKGLFVLHEGISKTIFYSQVLEHVKDMQKFGYAIDILSYNTEKKVWYGSLQNLKQINKDNKELNVYLRKGYNIYFPFSHILNTFLLYLFLRKKHEEYSFIHARASYSTFICLLLSCVFKIPIIWDCRGDSLDELKDALSRKNKLIRLFGKFTLVYFEKLRLHVICKNIRYAFFVSEALFQLYKAKLPNLIRHSIIPCPVSEKLFFFNPSLRQTVRNELKIRNNQKVFLYSGSMVAYQALEKQKQYYGNLLLNKNNIIFYVTSEPELAKKYFNDFPKSNFFIFSVHFEKINRLYNAADFAFLFREKKLLNWVASPTKFGEYCLAGLQVIMDENVKQANDYSKEIGNHIDINISLLQPLADQYRSIIANRAKKFYSREILNSYYLQIYNKVF